jgi:hypothetical protein
VSSDSDLWVLWWGRQMVLANILQKSVWKRIIYKSWHDCSLVALQSKPAKLWILDYFGKANCSDTNLNKTTTKQQINKGLNMLVATTWTKSVLFILLSLLVKHSSVWCVSEEMRNVQVNLCCNSSCFIIRAWWSHKKSKPRQVLIHSKPLHLSISWHTQRCKWNTPPLSWLS